jgi:hypothetical protein
MLHEGNEVTTGILPFALRASRAVQIRSRRICQGKYGKQGWLIARRCIAVAMEPLNKGDRSRSPTGMVRPAMRRSDGRAMQEQLAWSRQIFPDFVQVQAVIFVIHDSSV